MITDNSARSTALHASSIRTRHTRIKICGITSVADAAMAATLGADAIGLIFTDSPRRIDVITAIEIARSIPPFVMLVGVFRDDATDAINTIADRVGLHAIQLHGDESPADCYAINRPVIKCFNVAPHDTQQTLRRRICRYDVSGHLLDPGAGDGRPFDFRIATGATDRLILAGGLNALNVADAISMAAPYAVDVCSGVEASPGIKDSARLGAFIREVRRHDAASINS